MEEYNPDDHPEKILNEKINIINKRIHYLGANIQALILSLEGKSKEFVQSLEAFNAGSVPTESGVLSIQYAILTAFLPVYEIFKRAFVPVSALKSNLPTAHMYAIINMAIRIYRCDLAAFIQHLASMLKTRQSSCSNVYEQFQFNSLASTFLAIKNATPFNLMTSLESASSLPIELIDVYAAFIKANFHVDKSVLDKVSKFIKNFATLLTKKQHFPAKIIPFEDINPKLALFFPHDITDDPTKELVSELSRSCDTYYKAQSTAPPINFSFGGTKNDDDDDDDDADDDDDVANNTNHMDHIENTNHMDHMETTNHIEDDATGGHASHHRRRKKYSSKKLGKYLDKKLKQSLKAHERLTCPEDMFKNKTLNLIEKYFTKMTKAIDILGKKILTAMPADCIEYNPTLKALLKDEKVHAHTIDAYHHLDNVPQIIYQLTSVLPQAFSRVQYLKTSIEEIDAKLHRLVLIEQSLAIFFYDNLLTKFYIHTFLKHSWTPHLWQLTSESNLSALINITLHNDAKQDENYLVVLANIPHTVPTVKFFSGSKFESNKLAEKLKAQYRETIVQGIGYLAKNVIGILMTLEIPKTIPTMDNSDNKKVITFAQQVSNSLAAADWDITCSITHKENIGLSLLLVWLDYIIGTSILANVPANDNSLLTLLETEVVTPLTLNVYARWFFWLCFMRAELVSVEWEETMKFTLRHSNRYIELLKKLKYPLFKTNDTCTELLIKLTPPTIKTEYIINRDKYFSYISNPAELPRTMDFFDKKSDDTISTSEVPKVNVISPLFTKLILLNQIHDLGNLEVYGRTSCGFAHLIAPKVEEIFIKLNA